jgi:FkbM family methyltransferase
MNESSSIIRKEFNGHTFYFHRSPTIEALINEIFSDNYHLLRSGLRIYPGDVILDLGANEGVFTIMMSAICPKAKIISLEPVGRTYKQLLANISINHINPASILTWMTGVGGSARDEQITIDNVHSGGSSVYMTPYPDSHTENIHLTTLDEIFEILKIRRCKILKIDVEGMEHETLLNTSVLPKVDHVVAEIHINKRLQAEGYSVEKLVSHIQSQTNLLHYEKCYMSE